MITKPDNRMRIVADLPCAFAKPGKTHQVSLVIKDVLKFWSIPQEYRTSSVLESVTCTCDMRSDRAEALQELSGDNNTCFSLKQNMLLFLRADERLKLDQRWTDSVKQIAANAVLVNIISNLRANKIDLGYTRRVWRDIHESTKSLDKQEILATKIQDIVNRVVANYTGLGQKFENKIQTDRVSFSSFKIQVHKGTISMFDTNCLRTLAVRNVNGTWDINEDNIKYVAQFTSSPVVAAVKADTCYLCNRASFSRISSHTEGIAHQTRYMELVKLCCKATSKVGFAMLNMPEYRKIFIGDR